MLVLWLATPSFAQENASRYVDPTSFVTVRIDVKRFDLPQTLALVQRYAPGLLPKDAVRGISGMATPIIASLKNTAGASEVVASVSTLDITTGSPSVVVSTSNPDAASTMIRMVLGLVPPAAGFAEHKMPGMTVVCTDAAWRRIESATAARQEVSEALEEAEDAPLSITLAFADSLALSVASLWPDALPADLPIKLSPKVLMQQVKSITLKAWAASEPRLELVCACRDADGTEVARREVESLLEQFSIEIDAYDAGPNRIAYAATGAKLDTLLTNISKKISSSARSQQAANDIKQLILAFRYFSDEYQGFVPRMTVLPDGKPLLSWRVHLLPFFGFSELYEKFHLDEPWNSPHNIELVDQIPSNYQSANSPDVEHGRTCVQAPMMDGSYWNGKSRDWLTFKALSDSTETICFVVAPGSKAVIWTKPDDLLIDREKPVSSLFAGREDAIVARFDGSVSTLPASISDDRLRAELTHASGD